MSYTEFHKGKIKIVARGDEAIKKYIKDNNLEERLELDIDEKTSKIYDLEDKKPFNGDEWDHEYHIITYRYYLPKTYDRNPNAEHLLIKYLEHEHFNLDDRDIDIHKRISKDEFEFAMSFYNGGACELEVYEDMINKYDLDEPFEEKKIFIRISKDYDWKTIMYKSDVSRIHRKQDFTMPGNYTSEWEIIEVTNDELFDYIKKGYAIKINC